MGSLNSLICSLSSLYTSNVFFKLILASHESSKQPPIFFLSPLIKFDLGSHGSSELPLGALMSCLSFTLGPLRVALCQT